VLVPVLAGETSAGRVLRSHFRQPLVTGGRGRRWERRSASAALPAAASPPQAPWKALLKSLKEDLLS